MPIPKKERPIQLIGLSEATAGVLERHGIETAGQLMAKTDAELLVLSNIGWKRLKEIRERLAALGTD